MLDVCADDGTEHHLISVDLPDIFSAKGEPITLAAQFAAGSRLKIVPRQRHRFVVGKCAVKEAVDPEELLVAALSNCHMLSFLHVARLAGFNVAAYHDHAEGEMEKIASGKQAITKVVLRPRIEWAGEAPEQAKLDHMLHEAHEVCFIANSVKTQVTVA